MKIVLVLVFGFCFSLTAQKKAHQLLLKGDRKLEKSDTTAALVFYNKALLKDSTCADAYAKISDVFVAEGNYDKAKNLLDVGLRITIDAPKDKETVSHLYSIRSFIHFTAENFHLAIQDLDRAITINTNNPNYFYMRALVKRMNGDEKGCCSDLRKAVALGMEAAKVYSETYCN